MTAKKHDDEDTGSRPMKNSPTPPDEAEGVAHREAGKGHPELKPVQARAHSHEAGGYEAAMTQIAAGTKKLIDAGMGATEAGKIAAECYHHCHGK